MSVSIFNGFITQVLNADRLNAESGWRIHNCISYGVSKENHCERSVNKAKIYTGFELIDMQKIAYQDLLNSNISEEVVLAVLGDFKEEEQTLVLQRILARLSKLSNVFAITV